MGKWPCSNGKLTSPLMSKNQGCACEANYLHQPARRIKLMRKSPVSRQIAEAGSSDIIVYPNRRRMIGWLALSGVPSLCHGLGTIGMIILMITIPEVRNQGGAIALVILLGSFFVMGTWLTRMLFSVTFSGEPTLVINHAGIRVGKIYGSADIFLPWEEVEAIYSAPRPPYKIFFVRPVDSKLFFSRLSPMMRFTCRLSAMGGAPIALYQSFLDQPADAILKQMQTHYKHKLH